MDFLMDDGRASTSTANSYQTVVSSDTNKLYNTSFPVLPDVAVGQPIDTWKYEMRREAQLILPQLYLGPFQTSKQLDVLLGYGVTHIVCIRDKKEALLVKPRFPDRFTYLTLDISDHEDQNLIRIFPQTTRFIDDAISRGGTVFVHCNGGISLAPSVVVGYVMVAKQLSYEDAVRWVQSRRYCMSLNQGFLNQLKEYEPIYRASVHSLSASSPTDSRPRKRSGEAMSSDGEDELNESGEVEGNEGTMSGSNGEWTHRPMRTMQRVEL
ncbi:phosphatases ii [Phaffia rhodozyma]|uniref:Phosphatases ii n=1 Tax=Phaffia rhodozyma TaxID=264483 RepID=A0A0F7SML1_PHARH|nr:phosphatases ii [Phaffia rhodozyma]